jgi:hypothetical protein
VIGWWRPFKNQMKNFPNVRWRPLIWAPFVYVGS